METLAAQPLQETQERQRSFDPLASVDNLRFDLEYFGSVQPETRQRVRDEELSYLVEGIPRASRTTFVMKREGDQLVYFNQGEWQPYTATLLTGLRTAEHEAMHDPRREFLREDAVEDLARAYHIRDLQPGERMSWHSKYRHDIAAQYGSKFMQQRGFQADRRMGFLYQAYCQEDGSVVLESQTIDQSDADAFGAVDHAIAENPDADLDFLVAVHDVAYEEQHGVEVYAGRAESELLENAWHQVLAQADLIDYHLDTLEGFARSASSRSQLETQVKKHLYGVWAAFRKRIDGAPAGQQELRSGVLGQTVALVSRSDIRTEVTMAYQQFARDGQVLIGCGGAIEVEEGEDAILGASAEDVFASIFGRKSNELGDCEFTSQKCPKCEKHNVKTTVSTDRHGKKVYKGACGCVG